MTDAVPAGRISDPFSHWLDAFRWIAAAAVMLAHVAAVMLPPYATMAHPGPGVKLFIFSTGFAHQAVMIFFVLSGYLVGGSFLRDVERRRVNLRRYMLKRLARLWVVIVPALAIAFLLAAISMWGLGNADFPPYVPLQEQRMSLAALLGTVFFTNTWLVQPFAFDLPLWSVASEFLYYVAWPILVLGVLARRTAGAWLLMAATIAAMGAITLVQFAGSPTLPYFLPWLFGAAASTVDVRRLLARPLYPALLTAAALVASRFVLKSDFIEKPSLMLFAWDIGIAALFALLLAVCRQARLRLPPVPRLHAPLANCSFSLYCLHYPVIVFVASVLRRTYGIGYHMAPERASTWAIVLGTIALNFLIAYLFGAVTERNTDRVRIAVERLLSRGDTVAHLSKV